MSDAPAKLCFARLSQFTFGVLVGVLFLCAPADRAEACAIINGCVLIVPNGCTHVVSGTESYCVVFVANGGVLELHSGGVLEISDSLTIDTDSQNPANSGVFRFYADDGETAPILRTTDSLEISGPITVEDPADGDGGAGGTIAAETANDWVILTADGTITAQYGPLDITADIEVDGKVLANASSTAWRIRFTGEILEGSTGLIEASGHSNARVLFDSGSAFDLDSAMDLKVADGARMRFKDTNDYVTAGGFSMAAGFFDIDDGVSIKFTGAYSH